MNADLFQKLYFSTSSGAGCPNHFNQSDYSSVVKQAVQPSMKAFNQGTTAPQKSRAPAPQRAHCTYATQYQEKPLDGAPVLNEMRHMIAATSRAGSSTNQVLEGLPLSSTTTTKAFYGDRPRVDPPERKQGPEGLIRIRSDAAFLESKSCFQRDFKQYDEAMRNNSRREMMENIGQLDMKNPNKFDAVSSYKRAFGKDRDSRHSPRRSRSVDALQAARDRQAAAFSGR